MIKSIRAKNFQTHEDTFLALHPGVNVVTGIGDSGKTALIRLVKWVKNNRPTSHRFRSDFADDDTVGEIVFDDGSVTHTKGSKGSVYEVSGEPEPFRKVKMSVPDVATELFNMAGINFQGQYDNPFLLTMTKGKLAQVFNRVAQLEAVGDWLVDLKTRHTEQHLIEQQATESCATAQATIVRYKHLDRLGTLVTEAKAQEAEHKRLIDVADAAHLVYGRIRNRLDRLERLGELNKAVALVKEGIEQNALCTNVTEVVDRLLAVKGKQLKLIKFTEAVEQVDQLKVMTLNAANVHHATASKASDLEALQIKDNRLAQCKAETKRLRDIYRQALQTQGKCPVCSTNISQKIIDMEVAKYE